MRTPPLSQTTKRSLLLGVVVVVALVGVLMARSAMDDPEFATGTGAVPPSIAADCSRNVEKELSAFINGLPPNSTVKFPKGGCYSQAARIEVRDKSNLVIDGNGSSFKNSAPNSGLVVNPNWLILRGREVRLTDMKIVGNFRLTGARSQQRVNEATVAGVGNQFNMGVGIYGGDGTHVTDTTIDNVFGDGVAVNVAHYIEGAPSQPLENPRNVHIERVKVRTAARHCYSPSQAVGFWLEDSEGRDCWYGAFDAELDDVKQKLQDVHVLRNTFADFNMFGVVVPVAGDGTNTKDIEIRDNKFLTAPDLPCNTVIEVGIYPTNPNTFKNVVVEGNSLKAHGVGVAFDHVEGGSIRGNRIDQTDRRCNHPNKTPLVRVENSTRVKAEGNGPRG